MTVWQRALEAATAFLGVAHKNGPPPAPRPEARPLPDPLRGAARGVRPAHVPVRPVARRPAPKGSDEFVWPPADDLIAVPAAPARQPGGAAASATPHPRERRRKRSDRRKRDRRVRDLGSPYGTERRAGHDDRQGDRRGAGADEHAGPAAGMGLSRDYFSQVEARVTTSDTGLADGDLVRFRD